MGHSVRRNPAKLSSFLRHYVRSQPDFNFHGKCYTTATSWQLVSVFDKQRGGVGQHRGEHVRIPNWGSLPLSRLLYKVPFVFPHSSSISCFIEKLPLGRNNSTSATLSPSILSLRGINLPARGVSSFSDNDVDGNSDSEIEDKNDGLEGEKEGGGIVGLIPEVDRVCKLIDELFALDRNLEAVLDECGVNLSHDLVVQVLERFRHARKPAFRFFCWAGQKTGFAHNSRTYNSMMSILGKTKQFETMVSTLEEMGEKGLLTMETFSIAMRAFAAAKERKKAVAIFQMMSKYNFKVGVGTFNSLLDCLGRAKLGKEAQALFGKLQGRFTPNLRTYTALLSGWCRLKNLMEAGKIWNEMIDRGFKPDVVAYNVMLEGLLRIKKRSDAIKLFHVMKAKGPSPDVCSYTILIQDLCKQRMMSEATEYFHEMIDSGIQPDAAVYTCLVMGFGMQNKMDMVYELLKEMKEKGYPPDGRTFNALIKLMTCRRMPDNAARIYKKMIQSGHQPTIHTYNMIMKSYFQIRNCVMGCAVWDEMGGMGCCPDDNSYTILINGLVSHGRSEDACKYLEEMIEKGMKAPQLDYNRFTADFSRAGKPDILEELAQKMQLSGKFEVSNFLKRCAEMMKKRIKRRDPPNRRYLQFAQYQWSG
uniref:Uncharacterized protein MANES_01G227300 n=1 Tax=Rhizophora mucronata TaxID=61149 RepID=A0A2P2PPZ4_RHIMU